jgi:hypothetical protein
VQLTTLGATVAPCAPPLAVVPQREEEREDRLLAGRRHLHFGGRSRIAGTVQEKGTPDRPV